MRRFKYTTPKEKYSRNQGKTRNYAEITPTINARIYTG